LSFPGPHIFHTFFTRNVTSFFSFPLVGRARPLGENKEGWPTNPFPRETSPWVAKVICTKKEAKKNERAKEKE